MRGEEYTHAGEELLPFLLRMLRGDYAAEHDPPANFLISFLNAAILLVSLVSFSVFALFIASFTFLHAAILLVSLVSLSVFGFLIARRLREWFVNLRL
jgi:hypothetical protein